MMKKIVLLLLISFSFHSYAQNKSVGEIGNSLFECVRDIDSLKLKNLLPSKNDLLGFISESSANNLDKMKFIKDVDTYFPDFENRIRRKIVRANHQGGNAGIDWKKVKYLETIEKDSTSKSSIKPINIDIKFSFFNTVYILKTKLIFYKGYYIADEINIEPI